jgi:hypothetical protein
MTQEVVPVVIHPDAQARLAMLASLATTPAPTKENRDSGARSEQPRPRPAR